MCQSVIIVPNQVTLCFVVLLPFKPFHEFEPRRDYSNKGRFAGYTNRDKEKKRFQYPLKRHRIHFP